MQKIISSSAYDTIVIRQQNNLFKSTPFQVVYSSASLKQKTKNKHYIEMQVNDKKIDVNLKLDQNGRVLFEKKYTRKSSAISDSQELSQQDCNSQKSRSLSKSRQKKLKNGVNIEKIDEMKNEQAPKNFWQFAWLFKKNKQEQVLPIKTKPTFQDDENSLEKIKQEVYQGQQNSRQPLYQLSLCGSELKKTQTKQQILQKFYKHKIQFSNFIKNPTTYFNDSNLVVRIDDSIYTWQLGLAILTCRYAYGKQLLPQQINEIIKNKFAPGKIMSMFSSPGITKVDISRAQNEIPKDIKKIQTVNIQNQGCKIKYTKNPSSESIAKMNLEYGLNKAKFILHLKNGNKQQICFKIFLWQRDQKVIISDIDGTITKSDVLGQILNNYVHEGVIKLYNQIYSRNYKIIYLTARAIGQYQQTTKFLQNVSENQMKLPPGPVLMSPDGYLTSFRRQIIDKTPDFLKTRLLAQLNEIFPNNQSPIYCGFGNRQTDTIAYKKTNINDDKIYLINEKSIINSQKNKNFTTTYIKMLENIDQFFPIYNKPNLSIQNNSPSQIQHENSNSSDMNQKFVSQQKLIKQIQRSSNKQQQEDHQPGLQKINRIKTQQQKLPNLQQKVLSQGKVQS